jgi:hypothetical protein
MYKTRESVDRLEKLGENKENVIVLLTELANLGWDNSHWVKYMIDTVVEDCFIEIYGDGSYFHIKGENIEDCYKKALQRVKQLKTCNHNYKLRRDAFKICNDCGQFGTATLEEMKKEFTQFSIEDENENQHFYSDQILCKKCDSKELVRFGLSLKDEFGYYCKSCKNVIEKRIAKDDESRWTLQIDPLHPDFHFGNPYQDEKSSLSLNKLVSIGFENKESLMWKIKNKQETLMEHVERVEKIIDPTFVASEKYIGDYLKKCVLRRELKYKENDKHYKIKNIEFTFENNEVKGFNLTLEKQEEKQKSATEIFTGVIDALIKGIDAEKK